MEDKHREPFTRFGRRRQVPPGRVNSLFFRNVWGCIRWWLRLHYQRDDLENRGRCRRAV